MMADFQVDLTNCAQEPIHIPGHIQSHGFMLAFDKEGLLTFFSDNIYSFLPKLPPGILGKGLSFFEAFLEETRGVNVLGPLLQLGRVNGFDQINPYPVKVAGKNYHLIISLSDQLEILEFEPASSPLETDVQKMIGRSVSEMLADKNLTNLLNNTVRQVKNIIQYDRVMVYRFAEDGHGEVVAEARNEDLESWLGLHYPASDIPQQARELYKLNLTRLIADVHSTPSKITTGSRQTDPLDLTCSQLRAVSPIHIQYLKNMGVASSFSISLIYKTELWGLIACHNYTPRFIDFKSRESAKLIGQILSSALEFRQDEENQLIQDIFKNNLDQLVKNLQKNEEIDVALTREQVTMLDITHSTGAVLVYEKKIISIGITPDEGQIRALVNWLDETITDSHYLTTSLSAVYPEAVRYREIASGMMASVLTRELGEYLIWFKSTLIRFWEKALYV